ncbi:L-type lectin-domain containing receptor kinase S.4-like [Nymphaea colorata]|uniref:non-specific serine/threonine protein kinase n=1 Tax=Nymphaea colorata TaxID=210225 RepID=A0A5K1ERU2_9MAGN|nr:L-type lectin-domain containing receptor kinase S.4-like [Nymphaea colorata]
MALLMLVLLLFQTAASMAESFVFHGFKGANLTLDGMAAISSNGLLRLTSDSHVEDMGHGFYPLPIRFKDSSSASSATVTSFSTRFVFAITSQAPSCHGLAFALSPTDGIVGGAVNNFLGLFNNSNLGNSSNHILAVEFDTCKDPMFKDINDNHVGIDINSLISVSAAPAAYLAANNSNETIILQSGFPIFAWIDYQNDQQLLNVSISPSTEPVKPSRPLLSQPLNLSSVLEDFMYVGFSSGVGKLSGNHYIMGWSFSTDGEAQSLYLSQLPSLPVPNDKARQKKYVIIASVIAVVFMIVVSTACSYVAYKMQKKKKEKLADIMEVWELDYPHRFSYRTLYKATDGFKEKGLLGTGGFGSVYKGVMPGTSTQVAVKRISHNGKQGLREFVAEVASLGRVTHRSLVRLQGWCRRQDELLLVYDFMPNGSLDEFLFDDTKAATLNWELRMRILKGIADGLLYLHKGWEQVVVHRDVKASNVLLDGEMNARLGDFGLARLHEHGQNPQTTGVMGTVGYLAPELYRTGKATVSADVFAYGALLLEVVCGKRPIHTWRGGNGGEEEEIILAEWVLEWWQKGDITAAVDGRLEGRYGKEEAELMLKLGLLCSQAVPGARPTMRQVVQFLNGEASIHKSMGLPGSVFYEDDGAEHKGLPSFRSMQSDYDESD